MCRGFNVDAVDANRRRSEKPALFRVIDAMNFNFPHLGINAKVGNDFPSHLHSRRMIWATFEEEYIDSFHRFSR